MIRSHRYLEKAFALPTILIASVVMIIVMLAAIQSVVSIRIALDNQYYDKLAQEAGESGTIMATNCIKQNDSTGWAAPLQPGTDCNGAGTPTYVLNSANVRTSFSVPTPTTTAGGTIKVTVNSKVELLRTSNSLPWKTFTQSTVANVTMLSFDISSGNDTTCATVDGKLWCWGLNDYGQIGNGTTTNQPVPYNVNTGALAGKYVYSVSSGLQHACATAGTTRAPTVNNSRVYCWGDNSQAQIGRGDVTTSAADRIPVPAALTLPTDRAYTSVSAGRRTCVIGVDSAGTNPVSWCWGENSTAQAGSDFNVAAYNPKLNPTDDALTTSNGAIRSTLNNGTSDTSSNSALLSTFSQINMINTATGCGVMTDFKAYCWGSNNSGTLGIGVVGNSGVERRWRARLVGSSVSAPTTSNYRFSKIGLNFGKACAIGKTATSTVEGNIYCWGSNGSGGVVDYRISSALSSDTYASVQALTTTGRTFKDIAVANWTTCALGAGANDGKVFCWGYNTYGQLGNGTVSTYAPTSGVQPAVADRPINSDQAVEVTGALSGKTVVKITSGNNFFCAMTTTGASYCWGRNFNGQLGDGTTTDRSSPVRTKVPISLSIY